MFDGAFAYGRQNYWKSGFLADMSDEALRIIVDHAAEMPSPTSMVMIENYHGAYSRVPQDATPYINRDGHYDLLILSSWTDPAEAAQNIQWARGVWQAVQPYSSGGVYVNYLEGGQEGAERIRAAYGPVYDRLTALKSKYDPSNFFRLNQNIKPTA